MICCEYKLGFSWRRMCPFFPNQTENIDFGSFNPWTGYRSWQNLLGCLRAYSWIKWSLAHLIYPIATETYKFPWFWDIWDLWLMWVWRHPNYNTWKTTLIQTKNTFLDVFYFYSLESQSHCLSGLYNLYSERHPLSLDPDVWATQPPVHPLHCYKSLKRDLNLACLIFCFWTVLHLCGA